MTAFFLEAAFIGVMIFGWKRFSPKVHLMATILVVLGTHHSAFWILSLNSWMHTPSGVSLIDGQIQINNWFEVIFNPSFPYRFAHMLLACYTTVSVVVTGVFAYFLVVKKNIPVAKKGFSIGLWVLTLVIPIQIFMGDMHGLNTIKHQPLKIAAMEGLWDTEEGAPTVLFGIPDSNLEKNLYALEIPKLSSLILTHSWDGKVEGIKDLAKKADRPNIPLVFFSFRIMVGIGFLLLFISLISLYLRFRSKLYEAKYFQFFCVVLIPAGFVSTIAGWIVAEAGRQPWIITGILKTMDAASKIRSEVVMGSLTMFMIVYPIIFISFLTYVGYLVKKGPLTVSELDKEYGDKDPEWMANATHISHVT
jgi:cytochrome d ubiquinol oxidase subunit I